jgi:uncharacterized membrane protein YraQ (UPF0718 family)
MFLVQFVAEACEGEAMATVPTSAVADRRRELVAFGMFVALAAGLLTWAKWWPYAIRIPKTAVTHALGSSIITGTGSFPPGFSLTSGLDFARTYFLAIWPALVAGLSIGAAVTVLVPKSWLTRALAAEARSSTLRGGLLSVPSMMCSCCAAPVAVCLRKRGASIGSAVAFWVGNPALNPAVLAFSFFVLGWQWTALRAAAGVLLVVGIVAFTRARFAGVGESLTLNTSPVTTTASFNDAGAAQTRPLAVCFVVALSGLSLRLLPEYLLLVVVLGALRGPLFAGGIGMHAGVLAVLIFAVAGALLPVPTAGEIPAIAALLTLGVSGPVAAALLITLPALSVPSLVMVRGVFPAKVLGATAAGVITLGLMTAAAAALIGL